MEKYKDLTTLEKQIIVTHLRSRMSTLQISKAVKRDFRTVKKTADNILYKRKRNKEEGFKDISGRDIRQLKTTVANSSYERTSKEIKGLARILKRIK